MTDADCLVIDDIKPTLAAMSEFGRGLVTDSSNRVRDAVTALAAKRRWTVMAHERFVLWGLEILANRSVEWLVLDPAFPIHEAPHVHFVRLTRTPAGLDAAAIASLDAALDSLRGKRLGVLDDAVASGQTMTFVHRRARQFGCEIGQIAVAASRRFGRDAVSRSLNRTRWLECAPSGDWQILHLRDACAFLPWSGRRTANPSIPVSHGSIEVRVDPGTLHGDLWQVFRLDRSVEAAVQAHRHHVCDGLRAVLGRTPVVADLALLGDRVVATVTSGQAPIEAQTPLDHLAALTSVGTNP